ncbi:hypothetical protein KKE06_00785 [Candidatus Micrarchaeota archaeon]|nr:hypothetical protein [Candidatus Micrarchaeota archaeon]MBU1930142.1 hypothetical protein [Candidatus Micrarchaeota archaeon]
MEEEEKTSILEKPRFSLGELVLFAVLAHLAFRFLNWPSPGPVIPFAVLAGIWYGGARGFLVGAIGFAFSELLLFGISTQTWFDALLGGIAGLFGIGGNEHTFLIRVLFATILFEIVLQLFGAGFVLHTSYYLNKIPSIALHFAANILVATALVYYLRPKN